MTDFWETWPTIGLELDCRLDKVRFFYIIPSLPTSRPKYSLSPSFIHYYILESLRRIETQTIKQLVKDCQCPFSIYSTWMTHLLHNSQRKRLGTILIFSLVNCSEESFRIGPTCRSHERSFGWWVIKSATTFLRFLPLVGAVGPIVIIL